MSKNHPPTLTQLRKIFFAAAASCNAFDSNGSTSAQDREELKTIISSFLSIPSLIELTAPPSHPMPHQPDEINEIKSTLNALTKSVNSLLQKATNPPRKLPPPPPTKAGGYTLPPAQTFNKATAARPSRASLVMNLKGTTLGDIEPRPKPAHLTEIFNEALKSSPQHQVRIAATRWTANGNLVLTGGHMTTAQQLRNCTDILALALAEDQPNVKWSKILINGTPTGVLPDRANAYSADECHEALSSENPTYASLLVTQKPSWVRPPSQYTAGSSSSLVAAFEDPDGTVIKTLLTEKHLYAFGARVTVKRWKQRPPKPKTLLPLPTARTPSPPPHRRRIGYLGHAPPRRPTHSSTSPHHAVRPRRSRKSRAHLKSARLPPQRNSLPDPQTTTLNAVDELHPYKIQSRQRLKLAYHRTLPTNK
ncbi:hypothetical protein BC826DRAFT_997319 [Russula brevipes]|nr:hypothetical protein BC826DRAFT_997319 [Russula brevipes]